MLVLASVRNMYIVMKPNFCCSGIGKLSSVTGGHDIAILRIMVQTSFMLGRKTYDEHNGEMHKCKNLDDGQWKTLSPKP